MKKQTHPSPATVCAIAAVIACITTTVPGCKKDDTANPPTAMTNAAFVDVTTDAGITHRHHKPILDHKLDNIMSWVCSVGAAAAAGDYNNDGWLDLYVTDSKKGHPNYLYRNNGPNKEGTVTFTDVAKQAGVADLNGDLGTSMDCLWGDYDNDGFSDLYVVRWGNDVLFRNNGDGTFTDVTAKLFTTRDGKPGTDWANGNAVIYWDYNLDGRLDIYVGNYFKEVDLWHLDNTRIMHDDFEQARNGGPNFLYRQNEDGTFTHVAKSLGVDDPGWTLAVGSADINNDGWPDLYCADDFGPDQLFINNRDGTLTNVSETAIGIDTRKGMNVDFGDFNEDGWIDIYVSNITTAEYLQEGNMLWHNNGPNADGIVTFTDISLETNSYDGGWGWGAKFFDYDLDGHLDLIAANGFISAGEGNYWYDLASWTVTGEEAADAKNWPTIGTRSFSGYETTRVWRNDGVFSFSQRAAQLGLDSDRDGRGVVVWDYDNDGDADLFIANQNQPPQLYRNDLKHDHHWLTVVLEADPTTAVTQDAIGTRVTAVTPQGTQIRERDGGNGFSGQSDPRIQFGLGSENRVTLLEVRWPDGGLQYLENVRADRAVTVRQNPSEYASQLAIEIAPPKPMARKQVQVVKAIPVDSETIDKHLSELEDQLRTRPAEFLVASKYRERSALYARQDRAATFFESLVAKNADDHRARIELACAYIDKLPTCGGVAAIVSKGTLASKALDQINAVIAKHDELWVAYYCRGMNHLHWPRALRHSDDAAVDFEKCLTLQKTVDPSTPKAYYVRTYIGLGDAYAKAGEYGKAKQAWRDGAKLYPESQELTLRLALTNADAALSFVENKRSLQVAVDTGLDFLDREP